MIDMKNAHYRAHEMPEREANKDVVMLPLVLSRVEPPAFVYVRMYVYAFMCMYVCVCV